MPTLLDPSGPDEIRERLREDFPYWAEKVEAKIVDKRRRVVPFVPKPGQLALDAELEAQRAAGLPMRAIVLKARQLGFSTYMQLKAIHRCTLRERYDAVTIAQNRGTGAKLYRMAETCWSKLPNDPEIKPKLGQHRRQQFMHFAGEGLWQHGEAFPDSSYTVDTAGEFDAGRGATFQMIHASEIAFWTRITDKLSALTSAIPDDPETLFVQESTPNGFNEFRDLWLDAEEGRSEWIAFFWPWWKEDEYARAFVSDGERERFIVGDPTNPYAEEEPDLVRNYDLTLEQLNWRRRVIPNKFGGDIRKFHQEMPSSAEEAFISSGQKVFDGYRTAQLLVKCEITDPRAPTAELPGPVIGDLRPVDMRTEPTLSGTVEVPQGAVLQHRARGLVDQSAPWRFWLHEDDEGQLERKSEYVMGVDVSGGKTETTQEPDYHAIQVIDHRTREQVAEYRSRIEPRLLVLEILLGALYFNNALVAIERTGSWGMAPLSILYNDFHYPFLYRSRKTGTTSDRVEHRLGWDTNTRTKPLLIAGMAELIRIEEDGIKSRALAGEIRTYTRTEKGTMEAEPGKYDDLLMAFMIAQEVARLSPIVGAGGDTAGVFSAPSRQLIGPGGYTGRP